MRRLRAVEQFKSNAIVESINKKFYMDDFLKSLSSQKDLLEVSLNIIEILDNSSFTLTKLVTNSTLIKQCSPRTEISDKCFISNEV